MKIQLIHKIKKFLNELRSGFTASEFDLNELRSFTTSEFDLNELRSFTSEFTPGVPDLSEI